MCCSAVAVMLSVIFFFLLVLHPASSKEQIRSQNLLLFTGEGICSLNTFLRQFAEYLQ